MAIRIVCYGIVYVKHERGLTSADLMSAMITFIYKLAFHHSGGILVERKLHLTPIRVFSCAVVFFFGTPMDAVLP